MENEEMQLMDTIYHICWYMRGSISREDGWRLSYKERKIIHHIIEENIENTKNSSMPLI